MGGPNLEVFKFGMYIMFPIGFMYYFGVNLDSRFAVPDFWPQKGQTHEIPFEKEEIAEELQRLKQRRLAARARRLAIEGAEADANMTPQEQQTTQALRSETLEAAKPRQASDQAASASQKRWLGWFK